MEWNDNSIDFYLNLARVYGFHLQGIKGEAVTAYRDPLITPQMEAIDAPLGEN